MAWTHRYRRYILFKIWKTLSPTTKWRHDVERCTMLVCACRLFTIIGCAIVASAVCSLLITRMIGYWIVPFNVSQKQCVLFYVVSLKIYDTVPCRCLLGLSCLFSREKVYSWSYHGLPHSRELIFTPSLTIARDQPTTRSAVITACSAYHAMWSCKWAFASQVVASIGKF